MLLNLLIGNKHWADVVKNARLIIKNWKNTKSSSEIKLGALKDLIRTTEDDYSEDKHAKTYERGQLHRTTHKPKYDFPYFDGEDVHKWLCKCNQYFDLEEIGDSEKLKLAS